MGVTLLLGSGEGGLPGEEHLLAGTPDWFFGVADFEVLVGLVGLDVVGVGVDEDALVVEFLELPLDVALVLDLGEEPVDFVEFWD